MREYFLLELETKFFSCLMNIDKKVCLHYSRNWDKKKKKKKWGSGFWFCCITTKWTMKMHPQVQERQLFIVSLWFFSFVAQLTIYTDSNVCNAQYKWQAKFKRYLCNRTIRQKSSSSYMYEIIIVYMMVDCELPPYYSSVSSWWMNEDTWS